MPQEQNVLRCYACDMYQVHIVKKAKKWQCKICNEKQSIQRVYFRGSGQDCRVTAQKLNMSKADDIGINTASSTDSQLSDIASSQWTKHSSESSYVNNSTALETVERNEHRNDFEQDRDTKQSESTWSKYLERNDSNNDTHNFKEHSPFKNNRSDNDNKIHFDRNTDENMWSDILEGSESDSDVDDVTASEKSLNFCNENSDTKQGLDVSYEPELTLYNRSNSFQNKQLHTESEIKSNTNTERASIFETNDGLDDICLDL